MYRYHRWDQLPLVYIFSSRLQRSDSAGLLSASHRSTAPKRRVKMTRARAARRIYRENSFRRLSFLAGSSSRAPVTMTKQGTAHIMALRMP